MYGVENLVLRNCVVHDSPSYGYHLATVRHVFIENCRVQLQPDASGNPRIVYSSNQDGLHINGPASDIHVTHFSGVTSDDFIALNADDGHEANAYGAFGYNVFYGAITDVTLDGVNMESPLFGIRLLSGTQRINRIQIKNIHGCPYQYGLLIDLFGSIPGNGNVGSVLVDGWDINPPAWNAGIPFAYPVTNPPGVPALADSPYTNYNPDLSNECVSLGGYIESLTLCNLRRSNNAVGRPLVYVNSKTPNHPTQSTSWC